MEQSLAASNPLDGQRRSPLPIGDQHELILAYTPLVHRVARNLPLQIPALLEFEDALAYGTCGLVEAAHRYDPARGVSFGVYAVSRIRGSIIDAFRRSDRLSRTMRHKAREIGRAETELATALGRTPTDTETARHLGVTLEQHRAASSKLGWSTVSLDKLLSDEDGEAPRREVEAPKADEDIDFTEGIEKSELLESLAQAVQALPERERLIISLYYVEQLTMREIADVLSVSETRISQLHRQAVNRLRRSVLPQAA